MRMIKPETYGGVEVDFNGEHARVEIRQGGHIIFISESSLMTFIRAILNEHAGR